MRYVSHTLQKQKWVQVAPQKKKKKKKKKKKFLPPIFICTNMNKIHQYRQAQTLIMLII